MSRAQPLLSIVIKAYNEEAKIARSIESALRVAVVMDDKTEVVVADSASTDRTIEIACRYPVRVVQLAHSDERGCGIGVELGYQHALGTFVYFLDGDMELFPDFIVSAMDLLKSDSGLGGVGGLVQDTRVANGIDRIRVNNRAITRPGECQWLKGGGLYRRAAIESAGGYAADPNLKGYEEAELGMRLRAAGWKLVRLPQVAATHTGHTAEAWQLLVRHWRSRRAMSGGVLLRSALGRSWLPEVCGMLLHPLAVALWWALLPLLWFAPQAHRLSLLVAWGGALLLAFVFLLFRKRDLRHATLSLVDWHYGALATLLGFFSRLQPPRTDIAARQLRDTVTPPA